AWGWAGVERDGRRCRGTGTTAHRRAGANPGDRGRLTPRATPGPLPADRQPPAVGAGPPRLVSGALGAARAAGGRAPLAGGGRPLRPRPRAPPQPLGIAPARPPAHLRVHAAGDGPCPGTPSRVRAARHR